MTGTRCPAPLLLLAGDAPNLMIAAGHLACLIAGGEVAGVTVRRDIPPATPGGLGDEEVLWRMGRRSRGC